VPHSQNGANVRTEGREPANAITVRYVEHLESEVEHLRGQIEAQRAEYLATIETERRESALTVAALREAIKAMPRGLPAPSETAGEADGQNAAPEIIKAVKSSGTPQRRPLWQRWLGIR
jgi:hypothetical protein